MYTQSGKVKHIAKLLHILFRLYTKGTSIFITFFLKATRNKIKKSSCSTRYNNLDLKSRFI